MSDQQSVKMILSRTRRNQVYLPYSKKKPYFEAIARGDENSISALAERNRDYPRSFEAKCTSYEEALEKMHYDALCATGEMCMAAVQAGLLDMVAYDIRDDVASKLEKATSLEAIYTLVHDAAKDYTLKMSYVIKEKKRSPRLTKMMTYIEEHLDEKIELAKIAEHVGVSRTYASALFKEELGITISEFILSERMLEAKRMLRDTNMTSAEISRRLGFCSQSYFTKNFTETEGMTPLEYRRQYG